MDFYTTKDVGETVNLVSKDWLGALPKRSTKQKLEELKITLMEFIMEPIQCHLLIMSMFMIADHMKPSWFMKGMMAMSVMLALLYKFT